MAAQPPGKGPAQPHRHVDRFDLALLVVVLLVLPTQYALTVKKIHIGLGDAMVAAVFGLWFLKTLVTGRLRQCLLPPVPIWLFLGAAALSILNSTSVYQGVVEAGSLIKAPVASEAVRSALAEFVQTVGYFVFSLVLLVNLLRPPLHRKTAVQLVLAVSGVVALYGLAESLFGVHALGLKALAGSFSKDDLLRMAKVSDPLAVSATFGSKNVYGGYLALVAPFALSAALLPRSRKVRWVAVLGLLAGALSILSGGALLGFAVGLLVTAFRHSRRAGSICALALVAFVALVSGGRLRPYRDGIAPFLTVRYANDEVPPAWDIPPPGTPPRYRKGDVKKEYMEWQADLNMLKENFLTGVGFGEYQTKIDGYYLYLPIGAKMPPDSNNLFLVLAGTTGILGLTAFLFLLQNFGARAAHLGLAGHSALSGAALGSLWAFGVTSVFHSLLVRGTALMLIFVLALVHAATEGGRATESET